MLYKNQRTKTPNMKFRCFFNVLLFFIRGITSKIVSNKKMHTIYCVFLKRVLQLEKFRVIILKIEKKGINLMCNFVFSALNFAPAFLSILNS